MRGRESFTEVSGHEISSRAWILTFSDLLTLMLSFFVLRLALSTADFEPIIEALKESRGEKSEKSQKIDDALSKMETELSPLLAQADSDIRLEQIENGARLLLGETTFEPGSDAPAAEVISLIEFIASVVRDNNYLVQVAGHTDDIPISSVRFPSNWELSGARASNIGLALIERGVRPEDISAVGYADTKPLADNDTSAGRALNRRVEIYFKLKPIEELQ